MNRKKVSIQTNCKNCLVRSMCKYACDSLIRDYLELNRYTKVKEYNYDLYRSFIKTHMDRIFNRRFNGKPL